MHSAHIWASLILAHTSTLLLLARGQYLGPFNAQRPLGQLPERERELALGGKRASTVAEPTCEELRAMWRYSKRQSRAAENTNELPVYHDPFSYNFWEAYPSRPPATSYREDYTGPARMRGAGGSPIYGKLVHKAPAGGRLRNGMPDRTRAFEEVARLYGTVSRHPPSPRRRLTNFRLGGGGPVDQSAPQSGSFQHLKELILAERARELQEQRRAEEVVSRANALKGMTSGDRRQGSAQESRNANFLSSLQGYQDPKSYDYAQAQYVPDASDIDQAFAKADRYGREYMLR